MSIWTEQNKIFLSLGTSEFLTILAYGEAGNQGSNGMAAVLNVVRNRTLGREFRDEEIYNLTGDLFKAVGLKKWQFSMFNINDPVRVKAENWAQNFQKELLTNSAFKQAYGLAQMALEGTLEDNTGGSSYYFNPAGVITEPMWASTIPFITQIGDHLFFGEGISAAVESVAATIEESAIAAIETMKEYPNITVLVLAGIGIGLVLELRKKKK